MSKSNEIKHTQLFYCNKFKQILINKAKLKRNLIKKNVVKFGRKNKDPDEI
jgi:hypothetical protein